ncbi:hypothetical protein SAY86_029608 [Trapa natans]|uniref:Uncharacterized protein n=1 Tax=Trapa natans TaxID=22666 RepID=A0AAN7RC29_TRANT|nr:hypothetical protein SAY86_029608 [Trapa natans]
MWILEKLVSGSGESQKIFFLFSCVSGNETGYGFLIGSIYREREEGKERKGKERKGEKERETNNTRTCQNSMLLSLCKPFALFFPPSWNSAKNCLSGLLWVMGYRREKKKERGNSNGGNLCT